MYRIFIPNRGSSALRIIRACKDLGYISVIGYSEADIDSMPAKIADASICIGGSHSKDSYMNIDKIISSALHMKCHAIHPGIGFLSESDKFAEAVEKSGLIFIGPSSESIKSLGNKVNSKKIMKEIGIPTVPSSGIIRSIDEAREYINNNYPIIIKSADGGGGKGMRAVHVEQDLEKAYMHAKSECKNLPSDDIYIEKLLINPRHIEFQILGDKHGNIICLGERDCSVQRKHQKIWEEAPSCISSRQREYMIHLIENSMKNLHYIGPGTLEFLFDGENFFFIEMNTRLQVEHTITEMITGIDIVCWQIRIAFGDKLNIKNVKFSGHAIECRINAEDPRTFIPSAGLIKMHIPALGPGIRIDSAIYPGYSVPHYYDSLISKLIVYAEDRDACLARLRRALSEYVIISDEVKTLLPLFEYLARHEDIINNKFSTYWLEQISADIILSS